MSIYLASATDYLTRTTSLLPTTGVVVWMGWFRQRSSPAGAAYNSYLGWLNNTPATFTQWSTVRSNLVTTADDYLQTKAGATDDVMTVAERPAGKWRHFAILSSTSAVFTQLYVDGLLVGSSSFGRSTLSALVTEIVGGDSFSNGDLDVAYVRQWTGNSPLWGSATIQAELISPTVVRTTGLYLNTPLVSDLLDISGNARHWTQNGAGTFSSARPEFFELVNLTSAGATLLPSTHVFEYVDTLPECPVGLTLWYKYVPATSGWVGLWVHPNALTDAFAAFYEIYNASLVSTGVYTTNTPIQLLVTAGTTYYIKVKNAGTTLPTGNTTLKISCVAGPSQAVTIGSLLINSDNIGAPTGFLDPATGDVRNLLQDFAAGELGDSRSDGIALFSDKPGDSILRLYNGSFALVASPTGYSGSIVSIRHNPTTGDFFFATDDGHFYRMDETGSILDTKTHTYGNQRCCIATSPDGLTLYWAQTFGTAPQAIKKYDFAAGSDLGTFATGPASYQVGFDMLGLPDGSILVQYNKVHTAGVPPGDTFVRRYAADGSTIQDYALGTDHDANRLAYDIDDAYFAAFLFRIDDASTSRFVRIRLSDGALSDDFEVVQFGGNAYRGTPIEDPPRFGVQNSCPFTKQRVNAELGVPTDPGSDPDGSLGSGDPGIADCCDKGTPSGDIGTNPDPIGILPAWLASCIGGGQPDTNVSLADGEVL